MANPTATKEEQTLKQAQDLTPKILANNLVSRGNSGSKTYRCFCCYSNFDAAVDHVNSPAHATNLLQRLKAEFIVRHGIKDYYCLFCNTFFKGLLDHIKTLDHQVNRNLPDKKSLMETNGINCSPKFYGCLYCQSAELSTFDVIVDHVNGRKHIKARMLKVQSDNLIVMNNQGREPNSYCYCCESYINDVSNHINRTAHSMLLPNFLAKNFVVKNGLQGYYCLFCDCHFDTLLDHVNSIIHLSNREVPQKHLFISVNNLSAKESFYFCNSCHVALSTLKMIVEHVKEKKHLFNQKNDAEMLKILAENFVVANDAKCVYYCLLCDCYCEMILEHLVNETHVNNMKASQKKSLLIENGITSKPKYYCCAWCNIQASTFGDVKQHLSGKKHTSNRLKHLSSLNSISPLQSTSKVPGIETSQDGHITSGEKIFQTKMKPQAMCNPLDDEASDGDEESDSSCILMDDYYSLVYAMEGSKPDVSKYLLEESREDKQLFPRQCSEDKSVGGKETRTSLKINDVAACLTVSSLPGMIKPAKKKRTRKRKVKSEEEFPHNNDLLSLKKDDAAKFLERGDDDIYRTVNLMNQQQLQKGLDFIYSTSTDEICLVCKFLFASGMQYLLEHLYLESHLEKVKFLEVSRAAKKGGFSHWDLAKACMIEGEDVEAIDCLACEVSVKGTGYDLQSHINSLKHVSKMKNWELRKNFLKSSVLNIIKEPWYFAQKFFCQLCLFTTKREVAFVNHLGEPEHLETVKSSKKENKIKICYVCSTCWYGSLDYSQHFTDEVHKQSMRLCDGIMVPEMNHESRLLLTSLEQNVQNLMRESESVIRDQSKGEKKLLKAIEDTVKPKYPLAKAHIFGSRISGLCSANSDVDVFLDCENIYHEVGSKNRSQKYICSVRKLFLQSKKPPNPWKNIVVLMEARVPIIRMQHRYTDLNCDVSFLSGLSIEKSKLIRNYVVADVRCRKLILFLKQWFANCNLYGSRAFNCYAISWYVIFYLQIEGIFPSVDELKIKDGTNYVDGWQCHFSEKIQVGKLKNKFRNLLKGFFSYYSKFDYQTSVACPLLGKVIKKTTFVNFDDLPAEMETYKIRIKTEAMEIFRFDSPLCIQDPVDLTQNITKAVDKTQLRTFRAFCAESYAKL